MDILIALAAVAVFLCPLACLLFFQKGVEYGRALKENKPLGPVINKPAPKKDEAESKNIANWMGWNGDKKEGVNE